MFLRRGLQLTFPVCPWMLFFASLRSTSLCLLKFIKPFSDDPRYTSASAREVICDRF